MGTNYICRIKYYDILTKLFAHCVSSFSLFLGSIVVVVFVILLY